MGYRERKAEPRQRARDRVFTRGIRVRMQQADRDRLGARRLHSRRQAGQFRRAQRLRDRAVEIGALGGADTHRARYQRRRPTGSQRVKIAAILASDLDQILEPGVGDDRDARALALKQRIGRDRRAVGHCAGSGTVENRRQPRENRERRILWSREDLMDSQAAVDQSDQIGEGASGIDSNDNGPLRFPIHGYETRIRILKTDGSAARANAASPSSSG